VGIDLVSVDIPWVIGIPLSIQQGTYRNVAYGGNILVDSEIGSVKAKKFVVVAVLKNGYQGEIQFLGKKPHNMELILGIMGNTDPPSSKLLAKCFSEIDDMTKPLAECPPVFEDALIGACIPCPIPPNEIPLPLGAKTLQTQNVVTSSILPQGKPDAIVSNEKLKQLLDRHLETVVKDFALSLPDDATSIATDALIAEFDSIDFTAIIDTITDDIIGLIGKFDDKLTELKEITGREDLTDIIKQLPQFEEDLKALEGDIKAIKDDVEKVGDSVDELEKFFGFLNTAWNDFKGAIGIT